MAMKCNFAIDINEERFSELKCSKMILDQALAIEEKYEIVRSNYVELERRMTDEIVTNMTISIESKDIFDTIIALNVKLINLLTSCRLYQDQVPQIVRKCLPETSEPLEKTKKLFSDEYDNNFDFSFMCALRNHVQHNGLAVHGGSSRTEWKDDGSWLEYSLCFYAEKSKLYSDKTFKKSILNKMPDKVDLLLSSRSCLESISKIHGQIRDMINEVVSKSRLSVETARNDFKKEYPDKKLYVLSACSYDNEQLVEEVPLSLEWDDIRKKLLMRNKRLGSLSKSRLIS